jgi:hypothetical protein
MSDTDESFVCPRWSGWGEKEAHWRQRNGFRVCSYCGSIHPDEWVAAVRESVITGGSKMNIDRGKPGKWYVRGADADGNKAWGKFYNYHMPEALRADPELSDQLHRAIRASWDRMFQHRKRKSAIERLGDIADDR